MSKTDKLLSLRPSMRLFPVLLLSLLVLASCVPVSQTGSGKGIETIILNPGEYTEAFFALGADPRETQILPPNAGAENDYILLYKISTLVHNSGASEGIAAMYVSGYDPNLFAVVPLEGFRVQDGANACRYHVSAAQGGYFDLSRYCPSAGDTAIAYGIGSRGSGLDTAFLALYNFDASTYADSVVNWALSRDEDERTTIFSDNRIFADITGGCEWTDGGSNEGGVQVNLGGLRYGDKELRCSFSYGLPFWQLGRSSKGALAVELFGKSMYECGNGCVPVPARVFPDKYIQGDTERYPGGQAYYVNYAVFLDKNRWPTNMNEHDQTFQFTTCSLYTTFATPTVCIDPTPGSTSGEVCQTGAVTPPSQRSPIQIDRIEQRGEGAQTVFTIHVSNSGNGRIFAPGSINMCAPSTPAGLAHQDMNVLQIVDARILGEIERLDCGDDTIRMVNGRGQIACRYDLDPLTLGRGAYQTSLSLEIAYLYRDVQSIQSSIIRI